MNLQTIYMQKGDYEKRKSAKTPPVHNSTSAHTPEARAGQTSNNIVPNSAENVNIERIGGVIRGTIVAEENLTAEQRGGY